MPINNYAVVNSDGFVENVIVWDGVNDLGFDGSVSLHVSPAADGSAAFPGGRFDGAAFTPPAPLPPMIVL